MEICSPEDSNDSTLFIFANPMTALDTRHSMHHHMVAKKENKRMIPLLYFALATDITEADLGNEEKTDFINLDHVESVSSPRELGGKSYTTINMVGSSDSYFAREIEGLKVIVSINDR